MTTLPSREETKAIVETLRRAGLITIIRDARQSSTLQKLSYGKRKLSASRCGPNSDAEGGEEPAPSVQARGRFSGPNHQYIIHAKDLK
jgi:hypothetical protein